MNYADIKYCDVANGKGVRVSLFVSGCTHHCKGCFNEETWNFHYGKPFTEETEKQVLDYLDKSYIAGLSYRRDTSGGEKEVVYGGRTAVLSWQSVCAG